MSNTNSGGKDSSTAIRRFGSSCSKWAGASRRKLAVGFTYSIRTYLKDPYFQAAFSCLKLAALAIWIILTFAAIFLSFAVVARIVETLLEWISK